MTRHLTAFTVALAFSTLALTPALAADEQPAVKDNPAPNGTLEEKMVGYWAPDAAAMTKKFKEQLGEDPNAAALIPFIEAMMANMTVQVKKGSVIIHAMGEEQTATFTVTKSDEATKTLTMKVKDDDGESEGTAKIDGDKLTLSKDGEDILLNRIQKEEFEKRKAAAQLPPALPPGLE